MGQWNYKKAMFFSALIGVALILFGQNFELVPKNTLLRPATTEENFISFVRSPQAVSPNLGFLQRFIFRRPPTLTNQDMNFESASKKFLTKGAENFLQDEEFRGSELGRTYEEIEKKAQVKFSIKAPNMGPYVSEEDIQIEANQNRASFKMQTQQVSTKMTYSMQSQNMDLLFQRPKNDKQSIGVGYDPKSDSSSVKMQLSW